MALNKFALVVLSFVASTAGAQTTDPPTIAVNGEGIMKVAPDQAWVRIGTESRSKVSKEAQQRNADVMSAVQQKLAALSIPKDALRTVGIDLQPEFDYRDGRQTLRGYVARNTIEVRIDDFAKVGDVLDAAVGSGATNVHDLRFDVKDRDAVEQQALQRAVVDGLAKANAAAAAAKRAVDRILRIEENFVGGPQPVERAVMMRMSAADAATPVAAGEIEIRAQVRLTVAIK
ncbi:MAG TPA: SIMPL domain-containing protein [Vicinamibacterales bacterium]|nr:SIMPL domain-containing protein [Vicinamibacterales bacterium]